MSNMPNNMRTREEIEEGIRLKHNESERGYIPYEEILEVLFDIRDLTKYNSIPHNPELMESVRRLIKEDTDKYAK